MRAIRTDSISPWGIVRGVAETSATSCSCRRSMKKSVLTPSHPERICWGCDRYCAADDLTCGNGTIRTPHPFELFGKDWLEWAERHEGGQSDRGSRDMDDSASHK